MAIPLPKSCKILNSPGLHLDRCNMLSTLFLSILTIITVISTLSVKQTEPPTSHGQPRKCAILHPCQAVTPA